ncbi:TraG family conjugative transposon ATPase [Pontibacter actiniarum]|uniref:Conjugal transfer protein TraG n=2 Tax=Pontibacter actiniarum TaxID=323450 RepID=A0A1X9YSC6_9BACT|nr:TraG family conjugative transposon ATPase [Pontibacter actiniarum]ARS35741.1 conjugal transfer protein TraG [Pontibacter actiniarum]
MSKTLQELWPLLGVEHDCLLSRRGEVTVAFRAELPELFTLSDQEYEAFHQAWVRAIKALPEQTVFLKQDWFLERGYQPDYAKPEASFLAHSSERFFNERPYLEHSCYILLTRKPEGRRASTSLRSALLRASSVPALTLQPALLQNFLDSVDQFRHILEDSGFVRLMRLGESELLSQRRKQGLVERYCTLAEEEGEPLRKDLVFAEDIQVGRQHARLYTLGDAADLPALCGPRLTYARYSTDRTKFSVGFAASLGQLLPCNHLYSQYIFREDAQRTLHRLERKRLRLQSLSAYSRENAIARDATNAFLNEALSAQRLPVKAHFNLLVWAEEAAKTKELKSKVTAALAQLDAVAKEETVGAPQLFWAGIPGNAGDFPMNETFDTFAEQASCFLNLETGYRSSVSPVGLRLGDRLTGRPLHVDLSDEPVKRGVCTNRNKFILGPSGSGKSFFTNHLVRSYYEQGTHVVLVDVGHSYRGLCNLVGGCYFTYDEGHPICFNPFHIEGGGMPDTEKKESIKTLLLALWKKDNEPFLRSEYVALSGALQGYYEKLASQRGLRPGFDSFYEYVRDEFVVSLSRDKVKEKDFDIGNFLYVLRPYYRGGEFAFLLNATEHLDLLSERFIVFELDNIKDHPILFPVVTIIIMEVFISKMRKLQGVRKMILIEEAWKAIAREGMAEYIRYLFKTVRKFYGEAVVVTQEVEDIISSPVVKQAIINNSDCKILLDQSKYQNRFSQIQELLGLTEKEKALVLSVNRANDPMRKYKEVFISLGGTLSKVYRTEVSPEEYLAYTTEEREKVQVAAYARRYGSVQQGIAALARDLQQPDCSQPSLTTTSCENAS